jgi:hypothetical protein
VKRALADFAGFQVAWWAAVLGAARGIGWAGPAAAGAYLALHLGVLDRSAAARRRVLLAAGAGAVLETLNLALGVTAFDATPLGLPIPPPWMPGLWAAFGATAGLSLGWMRGRYVLAAILGAVAGPLSFAGGERLGALRLGGTAALAVLAVEWAVAMVLLARPPAPPPPA